MKRVPNRRKRESQIGGREKCDFCVYNMEEKLVFPVDTCYLCVSDSNDVPNLVVTMHFRQEKWLESRIGRSQGVRSTDPLPRASGLGKLITPKYGTASLNHGAISTKETNKQIQSMIELGSDKNDKIEDLSKFWPYGQHIWIKIMKLSDVDITKCLSGWYWEGIHL